MAISCIAGGALLVEADVGEIAERISPSVLIGRIGLARR